MLEARGLSFGYPGAPLLYDRIDLAVRPGERVRLAAPSGFGKTTLCRLLAGYERPLAGEVLVDGAPLPRADACPVQLIGQHPELTMDPLMKVGASLEEAQARDEALMESLGIRPEWLGRYPRELSGGELQRCCVARALAVRPAYLIADEASTMLDAVSQAELWRFLLGECEERGMGLLVVTHSPGLAHSIATRTVELSS